MRKLTALLLALLLALASSAALADSRITVIGTGETLIPADTAVVSLGVTVRDTDVLMAQSRVNSTIASIRQVLTDAGIDPENISTGYISLYAIYDYSEDNTEHLTAYSASSTLSIRVTDTALVGQVIDMAFTAGANTLEGVYFYAEDNAAAKDASLKAAVADARAKADVLAEASGLRIVGIEAMQEGGISVYDSGSNNLFAKTEGTASAGTVVQAAKISVSVSVTVTFTAAEP